MILRIAGVLLFVMIFNGGALLLVIGLPFPADIATALLLGALFYGWSTRRGPTRQQRLALLRARPPRAAPAWVLLCCVATLLIAFGISAAIAVAAPDIDEIPVQFRRMMEKQETLPGWIALSALTVLVIPLVEEFSFRGRIQRLLERRYGVPAAVVVTALLFMSLHIGVPHWSILSLSLMLGVAAGAAVHLYGSIWVPVLMHSLWNGSMAVLGRVNDDPVATFGPIGDTGLIAIAIGFSALGTMMWLRIARAGRPGLRHSRIASGRSARSLGTGTAVAP